MGLTPLDGLVMGTRSGSVDPSIITYMMQETGKTAEEIVSDLNKNSGLLGICGKSDFRDVEKLINEKNENAILAFNKFRDSIVKYIAYYYVLLDGNVDAIVFTAGIGENVISIRKSVIDKLSNSLGIKLNEKENSSIAKFKDKQEGLITTNDSKIPAYVIPTNEELMILNDTYNLVYKDTKKLCLKK